MKQRLNMKPLSANAIWQGKRFKTPKYKAYEKEMLLKLKPFKVDEFKELHLTFGFSSKLADIDNPVKAILDILQKKYNVNDRYLEIIFVKKEIVKKGFEFIEIEII